MLGAEEKWNLIIHSIRTKVKLREKRARVGFRMALLVLHFLVILEYTFFFESFRKCQRLE